MLVDERKQVRALLLDPVKSRSLARPFRSGRECRMFVDAAVWLGLVRVLRFLKLGSGAGDEVDASSCGGAVVTALAGSRLPGLRASSLVALEASLPCTIRSRLALTGDTIPLSARGYLFESGCRLRRATEPWPERTDHQPPCGSRERARQELSGSRTNPNVVVLTLS